MDAAQRHLARRVPPLFVDEIHRFNKASRRCCPTPKAELGPFIGATTENPSFEVNAALLSRAQVYAEIPGR